MPVRNLGRYAALAWVISEPTNLVFQRTLSKIPHGFDRFPSILQCFGRIRILSLPMLKVCNWDCPIFDSYRTEFIVKVHGRVC